MPDAHALILRIDKQVVQEIIVRPDGGKTQAMTVLCSNPNHFVTGCRVKVFKLPVCTVQPWPGFTPGVEVERAQERAVTSCQGRITIALAVIENISIVGFVDLAISIADQHVVLSHIGPVGSGIRSRQVT